MVGTKDGLERRLSFHADDVVNSRKRYSFKEAGANTQPGFCGGCFSFMCKSPPPPEEYDVVLIGGGIMSATLGVILQALEPTWKIVCYEKEGVLAEESSNGWNNAGTGHAALCELNYTPENPDGTVGTAKATLINEQFQVSRQFWSGLIQDGKLDTSFISHTPHMSFVTGEKDVKYLKTRYDSLKKNPLFAAMQYSEDPAQISKWAPHLITGRDKSEKVAATWMDCGSDCDFGNLTKGLFTGFSNKGGSVQLFHTVKKLSQSKDGTWNIRVARDDMMAGVQDVKAKFVFVGAGGASITLLQMAGIKEGRGFGGFPISGQFMVCQKPEVCAAHNAKVYGKAKVGAPPMSVPHLDSRIIDGKPCLLFGPYAGFSPRFLKSGSLTDLVWAIKPHNIIPMAAAGLQNLDLTLYLMQQLMASKDAQFASLKEYMPSAKPQDWLMTTAGQRVQIMKADEKKIGILQFGTEVVAKEDGTMAGLLGASPGASVAVSVALDVLAKCFEPNMEKWTPGIKKMIPYYGIELHKDAKACEACQKYTAGVLGLPYP
eukprot:gnl/TRDRNA2_/TRDRNA2_66043_c0_seq1.p1 gnl/TRDRNA2_/TRDRNA2_66043_c0~~gnl/TRDRNA2_/TRDRNA2_66043_c0_seq1.p1  ORF type:complete len:543 (-),score=137.84 gnl/TRDRNA2_/TRDRNA2_66043_c0_seq1:47-1675(-)